MKTRRNQVEPTKPARDTSLEGFASTCSMLAISLFALTFIFKNFVIPSASMASTLMVGDHVMVERSVVAPPAEWAPFLPYREIEDSRYWGFVPRENIVGAPHSSSIGPS